MKDEYESPLKKIYFYIRLPTSVLGGLIFFRKKRHTPYPTSGIRKRGVGGFALQEFDPLPTQRVPLCTILRYPFLVTDPKIFLKEPIYTYFKGERAPKKRVFLSKFYRSCLRTPFWPVFSKFCLRCRKYCQNGVFIMI